MAELIERVSSTLNPKIHSDSGYGSNKSNSQSQRSSGSSKSQQSSLSSGSGKGYPPHPNAPVSNADCQPQCHGIGSPGAGSSNSTVAKRQGKKNKNNKLDRKPSSGEKNEPRTCHDGSQPMELGVLSMPSTPQPQSQMSPASKASSTHDSKALQVAALTHALSSMKKFQEPISESETNDEAEDSSRSTKIHWQDYFSENFKDASNEDAFASVVSLDDGVVVYVTPTISQILGFPKDMLCGRSFIDFVHPKDRMAFASHITCGINFPIGEQTALMQNVPGPTVKSEPFYCRLRQYRGLKTVGFGVIDKSILYHPFKLTMALKNVETAMNTGAGSRKVNPDSGSISGDNAVSNDAFGESSFTGHRTVYLVIVATRIKSAYQYPDEVPKNPGKFVTRHSASCHFGHMDSEAISYLGHLPQDLIGNSVLDYYHPEDMTLLKDIYGAVMQEQGKPFRSKPYRFRVFNGSFALLETDWSCFINPWSWKLEFVIGQHRVVQGPMNPNVFMQPPKDEDNELLKLPDGIISDGHEMQDEIRKMLTETVTRRLSSDPLRQQSSRRRKDLAALMETLLEQMAKTENSDKSGSQCSDFSVMERDSVMLGEISPHHDDHSGSNQSSSTPPSYNQLNYRENIERFFQSQPKTVRSDESAESNGKMDVQNQSSESDGKSSPQIDYSSSSNIRNSSGTSNESGGDRMDNSVHYGSSGSLTQELLTRHNEDMEKYMIQRHKDSRGTHGSHKEGSRHRHSENIPFASYPVSRSMDDSSDFLKYSRTEKTKKNIHKVCSASYFCNSHSHTKKGLLVADDNLYDLKCDAANHGLKRTGNLSWDGDSHNAKQPHLDRQSMSNSIDASNEENNAAEFATSNSINLWPPFSISMTPGVTTPSFRYTYPCSLFANPSSAGHYGQFSNSAGVCIPGGYHYVEPQQSSTASSTNYVRTGAQNPSTHTGAVLESMNPNAGAPLIFVPGQQQFMSQQVQLLPAGVVYQTISPQMFGQHPQILMPLGTMIHPGNGQSMFISQLASQQPQQSAGTTPATSTVVFSTPSVSTTEQRASKSKPTFSGCGGRVVSSLEGMSSMTLSSNTSSTQVPPSVTLSTSTHHTRSSNASVIKAENAARFACSSTTHSTKLPIPVSRSHDKGSGLAAKTYVTNSSFDGSSSEDSMNISSVSFDTKDSKDIMDDCNEEGSKLDHRMTWQSSVAKLEECQKSLKNVRNKEPPWLEKVEMTDELTFRYKLQQRDLSDILQKDLKALKIIGQQSPVVNDQLSMLYHDLRVDGYAMMDMNLEETISNSSEEDLSGSSNEVKSKKLQRRPNPHQYGKMAIVHEENAPFPPDIISSNSKVWKEDDVFKSPIPVSSKTTTSKFN